MGGIDDLGGDGGVDGGGFDGVDDGPGGVEWWRRWLRMVASNGGNWGLRHREH